MSHQVVYLQNLGLMGILKKIIGGEKTTEKITTPAPAPAPAPTPAPAPAPAPTPALTPIKSSDLYGTIDDPTAAGMNIGTLNTSGTLNAHNNLLSGDTRIHQLNGYEGSVQNFGLILLL